MKRTWWFNFSGFVVILVLLFSEQTKKAEALKSVRHGRHRRVSGPDPVVLNSNGRQVKEEQKENKHKPNFERCDDYTPEVLEEEPVGKFLFLLCTNLFVVNPACCKQHGFWNFYYRNERFSNLRIVI